MAHITMWGLARQSMLERHDFYAKEAKKRIIRSFDDLKEDADEHSQEFYDALIRANFEDGDESSIADIALGEGKEYFFKIDEMRSHAIISVLAALYNQWDKNIRFFLESELRRHCGSNEARKFCWENKIEYLFKEFEKWGWTMRENEWFARIDICRLIVNVHKHGKGSSLKSLAEKHPQYIGLSREDVKNDSEMVHRFYDCLCISEEEFDELAGALRQFWIDFPDRLLLPSL